MGKQERRISYKAGITRTPSDFLCQDGELAECINLTTDNEELKSMVPPKEWMSGVSPEILYVHRINGEDIFIGVTESEGSYTLEYGEKDSNDAYSKIGDFTVGGGSVSKTSKPQGIVSIGRILVVSYSDQTLYFQWDPTIGTDGGYKGLSSSIPEIKVEFSMYNLRQEDPGRPASFSISGLVHHRKIFYQDDPMAPYYCSLYTENESEYEAIKDVLIGAVSERIRKVAEQKRFAFPFWARYAVRLYDGSYTSISQPFLLFPTVNHNCDVFFSGVDGVEQHMFDREWPEGQNINYRPLSAELTCRIPQVQGLSDWSDIIAGVDIFVSEQQTPFNLEGDWHFINPFESEHQGNYVLYNHANGASASGAYAETGITSSDWDDDTVLKLGFVPYFGLSHINDSELMRNLLDKSVFYRIAQIDLSEFDNYQNARTISDKMTETTLRNLTSQSRLDQDDYYSRSTMTAKVMKAYNSRLHMAGVSRSLFDGFDLFTDACFRSGSAEYRIAVSIKTDSGMRTVVKDVAETSSIMNIWFYYPDPRATRVQIYKKAPLLRGYLVYDIPLTEHKGLNGAYFFDHLPYSGETLPADTTLVHLPVAFNTDEEIRDRVFVSEVDNPFVFTAKGDVKVGQGDIIGLATQTVALGQEEHGLHPLTVFTERGISTLKVSDEGYYLRSDELNREVCINAKSITETDGAVFFVSKKGLMVLAGEQVRCVSEQVNGLPFSADGIVGLTGNAAPWADIITACRDWYLDSNNQRKVLSFLGFISDEKCRIAYDYTDSRLLLIHSDKQFAFVFNMADGSISKTVLPGIMKAVVNNYPDYIMQTGNKVYTLYGKALEESLTERTANSPNDMQRAFILTRPMKLAGPLTVSSLRELVNVGTWQKTVAQGLTPSEVKTEVWLSDDLFNWHQMSSRFGAAARYFRIGLFINMLPTERLSGTIITEQERRTDNLRA